ESQVVNRRIIVDAKAPTNDCLPFPTQVPSEAQARRDHPFIRVGSGRSFSEQWRDDRWTSLVNIVEVGIVSISQPVIQREIPGQLPGVGTVELTTPVNSVLAHGIERQNVIANAHRN